MKGEITMTRNLFIIVIFFFGAIILANIIIRIYAYCKMQKLYDELSIMISDFDNPQPYAQKYVEMLAFWRKFHHFLSYEVRVLQFKSYSRSCAMFYPEFAKKIHSLYLR